MKIHSENSILALALAAIRLLMISMVKRLSLETTLQLSSSPAGRIVLHVVCCWKDHLFLWHWQGIRREFRAILPYTTKRNHA